MADAVGGGDTIAPEMSRESVHTKLQNTDGDRAYLPVAYAESFFVGIDDFDYFAFLRFAIRILTIEDHFGYRSREYPGVETKDGFFLMRFELYCCHALVLVVPVWLLKLPVDAAAVAQGRLA